MPAKAGIQYSPTLRLQSRARGILDRPVEPDDDGVWDGSPCTNKKKPGLLPAFSVVVGRTLVRGSALGRGGRPRLDQGVVVDGFALRLLVRQLALRRDVAILRRL